MTSTTAPARLATPADAALLTSIVMHPDVHAGSGGGDFNPADYTAHPKSFAVVVDGGCFTARALEAGAYEIHTNLLPEARGESAVQSAAAALRFAFTATDAERLYTMVPDGNKPALVFALSMGFRKTFHGARAQFLRLDIDDWILQDPINKEAGAEFHEWLGDAEHAEDQVHDAFVGATALMVRSVQFPKAERVYGRWARLAGYHPFQFISADPVRIDIGSHVLRLDGTEFHKEAK